MALLIDWGGVLTTSMLDSFGAFERREGVDVRAAFRGDEAARRALIDLETGAIDIGAFEQRLGRALGVDPHDLANRLTQDVRPDQEMLDAVRGFHDQGIPTALVSNSWREDDYDVDDLLPPIRDALTVDGKLYAAPFYGESWMVMYRKDLFEKAGVTMPDLVLLKFIQATGVCPGWLLTGEGQKFRSRRLGFDD